MEHVAREQMHVNITQEKELLPPPAHQPTSPLRGSLVLTARPIDEVLDGLPLLHGLPRGIRHAQVRSKGPPHLGHGVRRVVLGAKHQPVVDDSQVPVVVGLDREAPGDVAPHELLGLL